jgi:hypothetical protein
MNNIKIMKIKTLKLSLRIILLCSIAMFSSYMPELYPKIFGDWYCKGSGSLIDKSYYIYSKCNIGKYHNNTWHWGYRHYLYLLTCIILLIIQIIEIINDNSNVKSNKDKNDSVLLDNSISCRIG